MMSLKILIISLYLFFLAIQSYGQDTSRSEVETLIKICLFQEAVRTESFSLNQSTLTDFMTLKYSMDTLKSEGFPDFSFMRIDPNFEDSENLFSSNRQFVVGNCDEYAVVIHREGRVVYRLKGFQQNDFKAFLNDLRTLGYPEITARTLNSDYAVDGLDLKCLYNSTRSTTPDKEKYPCLKGCADLAYVE
jgi:hypothetical protein